MLDGGRDMGRQAPARGAMVGVARDRDSTVICTVICTLSCTAKIKFDVLLATVTKKEIRVGIFGPWED